MNVKQSFFSVVMLSLLATISYSQDNVALMAGVNQNTIIIDPNPGVDYQDVNLFFAGISIEEYLSSKLKLNTFLQYAQKGAKLESVSTLIPGELTQRSQYIDLIPNLEYKINKAIGLYVGGSASYHLRTDVKVGDQSFMKIDRENYKDFSFGSVAGIKAYLGNVAFNFHWNREWTENTTVLLTDANGNSIGTGKFFNQSFQLGMTLYL